ncbi:MAG: DNA-protecting protein DprA [Flavobacteriales bacterium]|nr:DNA-protecting protein DprA [Flavobacteriales bacterium]
MASLDYHSLLFQIRLSLIPRIGSLNAKKLVSYLGSTEAVFHETKKSLVKIPGIGDHTANSIISAKGIKRAEQEIEFISKNEIKPLFYLDDDYPYRLKNCDDGPILLFYKGKMDLNKSKMISIVGTRNATSEGKKSCEELIENLTKHNCSVTSGLAYGVDICAHKACVKNKLETIGVVAHGLDRLYPNAHKNTAEKMLENGGIITEFLSTTNPDRENFPKRNRIIAGLTDATIVIESGPRGGSLITADIANSYDREVFAYPGKSTDEMSTGCNWLIKKHQAFLMEDIRDLEFTMQWEAENPLTNNEIEIPYNPSEEEMHLLTIIKKEKKIHIDDLVMRSGFAMSTISSILLNLEFAGQVIHLPGKIYTTN